ncbi:MAG: glycosyltransferase [Segetibacter sp.]
MEVRKRMLIIHPALAPYRIDFFNHLHEYFNVKLLLINDNISDNPFNQFELRNNLKFEKKLIENVFKIGNRTVPYNFISEIRDYNPEIIICSEFSLVNNLVLLYRILLNKHFKIFTLTDDNQFMIHKPGSLLRRLNKDLICRLIDGIITVDIPEVYDYYKEKIKGNNVIGVHHLVRDKGIFKKQLLIARKEDFSFELYSNKKKLLFVGRLLHQKGIDILFEVFSEVVKIQSDLVLFIVGEGSERSNLEGLIKKLNLVKFVCMEGRKEGIELLKYYVLCDLFILPSRFEVFGAVVNEALVAGLPVICSDQVGAKCLINEGLNGSIFNLDDNNTFLNSLNYWLSKIDKSNKIIDKEALTTIDVKVEVEKLAEFLKYN